MKLTKHPLTGLAMLGMTISCLAAQPQNKPVAVDCPKCAKAAAKSCPVTKCKPAVKVQGRAFVVDPDGVMREFKFGEEKKFKNKNGGARLKMDLAFKQDGIEELVDELEAACNGKGFDKELLEKALEGLGNIDKLADTKIHGFVVGPDGVKHELKLGNATQMNPKKFNKRLKKGGATLELGIEPGAGLEKLLGEALAHLVESGALSHGLEMLEQQQARKHLNDGAGNPDAGGLLGQVMGDPALQGLLQKGLQDPDAMKLLQQGMNDPALMKMAQDALKSGAAQDALNQFLGGASNPQTGESAQELLNQLLKTPTDKAPEATPKKSSEPKIKSKPEKSSAAEIRSLKRELEEQRAMLEKILNLLEKQ